MSDNEEVRAPKRQKTITNQDAPMPAPKPRVPSLKAPGPLFPSLQIPKAKAATGQTPTPQTPTLSTSPTQSPSVRRPEATVDICDDGDTVLVVSSLAGISKPMGIRVSSTVLTLASPVFKRLLSTPASLYAPASLATPVSATPAASGEIEARLIHLSDDGDSIYMLCNILHLQNDKLPTKIAPELLFRFIATSSKYQCLVAISRACGQWLDHIYHHLSNPPNGQLIFQLIETSMILNDAVYFARFTSKWVLSTPLGKTAGEVVQEPSRQRLAGLLLERQKLVQEDLKKDLDIILDPLAEALSEDARHYV
ncbi:hypothetical protein HII31_06086 [Pseudocercospora fuligena]|uniref:BTB domain-containing protein n=1 Tax=Pseudocercospora fuligena TaxID=685502 RepID=A0A8H6RL28_9PEZI|nr:hypothetical protein HII31_06086 [Pseudocercospora fuligena]